MRRLAIGLLSLLFLSGCAIKRTVTFTINPPDATVSIDGAPAKPAPLTTELVFHHLYEKQHQVTITRSGYQDMTLVLDRNVTDGPMPIDLKPFTKKLTFTIVPVPAIISVNKTPLVADPVSSASAELEFSQDANNHWTRYTITASRQGFATASRVVTYTDPSSDYILQLQPLKKDLTISTTPPGAQVFVDGDSIGQSPAVRSDLTFAYDTDANKFATHKLRIEKPGYDPYETQITWDDGKTELHVDLPAKRKTVRILTVPAGATVTIDGKPMPVADDGIPTMDLSFAPINSNGDLPTYQAVVTKKTAETEWETVNLNIGWDNSKTDYTVALKEVRLRPVPMLWADVERDADGVWEIVPRNSNVLGAKDTSEGAGKDPPLLLYQAPRGTTIGSLSVSPTGQQVIFSQLSDEGRGGLRSQLLAVGTDGTGGIVQITDGKALDIMPSVTPDGEQVVFSSNRAGKRLNIWRKSLGGGAGIEQLTSGEEQDLWPNIDALPKPRVFYQGYSDSQPDAQLYVSPVEGGARTDLTSIGVGQPRVSPKADSILFTAVNQRTGNREIYRVPDRGGPPVNLTNDPDSDCYDPTWSRDGSQIAYTSNRGLDEDRRRNPDIWIVDLAHPDKPIQVTANGSVDDRPSWDPSGTAIYFRSNRGGQWGIWKITLK